MTAVSAELKAGTRVGRYRLLHPIATGGMAHVWLAEHEGPSGFRKRVVLKMMHPELTTNAAFVRMFIEEAALAARFEHDNVVRLFDFGTDHGRHFIVMEHIAGRTLRDVLKRHREQGAKIDPWLMLRIAIDVCEALDYLHNFSDEGTPLCLVHRDVSPENIMISFNGTVKLLDFGVSHSVVSTGARGLVVGKYRYMAPERLTGDAGGPLGDVYSLGMILYEVLTGSAPFRGKDARALTTAIRAGAAPVGVVAPHVPRPLQLIVGKAIEVAPDGRFETAARLARALRRYLVEFEPENVSRSIGVHLVGLFPEAEDIPSNVRATARSRPSERPPWEAPDALAVDVVDADEIGAILETPTDVHSTTRSAPEVETTDDPPHEESHEAPASVFDRERPHLSTPFHDEPRSVFEVAAKPGGASSDVADSKETSPFDIFRAPAGDSRHPVGFGGLTPPESASADNVWSTSATPSSHSWTPADWGIAPAESEHPPPHDPSAEKASLAFDRGLAAMRENNLELAEIEWSQAVELAPNDKRYAMNLRRLKERRESERSTPPASRGWGRE